MVKSLFKTYRFDQTKIILSISIKKLHIVSFDVPFPPNYGGVIDVFYKLIELKKLGVEIHYILLNMVEENKKS